MEMQLSLQCGRKWSQLAGEDEYHWSVSDDQWQFCKHRERQWRILDTRTPGINGGSRTRRETAVIVDGGWSKRSHKHSYNANSGVAIIIGKATGKTSPWCRSIEQHVPRRSLVTGISATRTGPGRHQRWNQHHYGRGFWRLRVCYTLCW